MHGSGRYTGDVELVTYLLKRLEGCPRMETLMRR